MKYSILILAFGLLFLSSGCKKEVATQAESYDQVHNNVIDNVRLGDGVPLNLSLNIRWKITDISVFRAQFESVDQFNALVLQPRMRELISDVSNDFPSVDSIFYTHRKDYIDEIKDILLDRLGEESVQVKEVILSDIVFPATYTNAMVQIGLQRQELERIRNQNIIDLEQSQANKKKAEADGKVAIARAEAQGRLEKIQAKTEESRRAIELARAETEKQVAKTRAQAEVERKKLLAKADLEKQEDLKNLEIQRQRDLVRVEIDKKKMLADVDFSSQMQMAKLCADNPGYASFIVNRELAAKVDIAVLPTGSDPTVFEDVIRNRMPALDGPH